MTARWRWLWALVLLTGCAGPAPMGVDLRQEAIALNDQGYQYYRQGRFNLAQAKFEQALAYNRFIDRREGIVSNLYYRWSKDFLEAGKRRLQGDTVREASSNEVGGLRQENEQLKQLVAEYALDVMALKKSLLGER